MKTVNLDHNATTATRPEVIETMAQAQAEGYANPASQHQLGQRARKVLEATRERIAVLFGADPSCPQPDRLIFTSGGTESNNLAILGITAGSKSSACEKDIEEKGRSEYKRLVISSVEHQSVIEPAEFLLEQNWRLDTLPVDSNGIVELAAMSRLITPDARLASVIFANHETGVLQPIAEIARHCKSIKVPMHTDAIQAIGKHRVDFRALGAAAMSVAAHKFGGPLGIGALLIRHDVALQPLMYGGHQQFGFRPGTESVPLALGMLTALELAEKEREENVRRVTALRVRFENGLRNGFPEIVVHGETADRLPNTSNLAFPGLDGQILLLALDMAGVSCSAGSACSSGSTELSPTLRAMGLPTDLVSSSLRFSLGASTTETEIDDAIARILRVCGEIRSL
jgi:cysteine desulfurase